MRGLVIGVLLAVATAAGCSFDSSGNGKPGDAGAPRDMGVSLDVTSGPLLLVTTSTVPGGMVDLTAEGTLDWLHLGLMDKSDQNHKQQGGLQLTPLLVGGGEKRIMQQVTFTWTDGTPRASASTQAAVGNEGVDRGVTILAPAGPETRHLKIFVAGDNARGRMRVTLSGNPVPPYQDEVFDFDSAFAGVYDITYRGEVGQVLTATYTAATDPAGGGHIAVAAATLR